MKFHANTEQSENPWRPTVAHLRKISHHRTSNIWHLSPVEMTTECDGNDLFIASQLVDALL